MGKKPYARYAIAADRDHDDVAFGEGLLIDEVGIVFLPKTATAFFAAGGAPGDPLVCTPTSGGRVEQGLAATVTLKDGTVLVACGLFVPVPPDKRGNLPFDRDAASKTAYGNALKKLIDDPSAVFEDPPIGDPSGSWFCKLFPNAPGCKKLP